MEKASTTIISTDGKIMLYSIDDFYKRIVIGNDCFICGAPRGSKLFNDEHILPDWLLRKYNLHNKDIALPNSAPFKYGRYTISCCKDCNTNLGDILEKPVSKLLKLSYSEICNAIDSDINNLYLLFNWLMLVFF